MSDFSTVLVEDPRLQLTDKVEFAVYKGASVMAPTKFPVIGNPSPSSQQFTITVPSLENLVDRCIILESTVTLSFTPSGNNGTGGAAKFLQLGIGDGFQAFPLQSLITTMSVQINSTQVNINLQDMLPQLLTMVSREELAKWNDMTPTYIDNYADFQDGIGQVNNPLGAYGAGVDPRYMPRGAWYYDAIVNPSVASGAAWEPCSITATFREPLLISPLLFGLTGAAIQGINQFQFQINFDTQCRRVWSHVVGTGAQLRTLSSISVGFTNPSMYVNFLTPSPYQLAKYNPRNVVDYYVLDRYVTSFNTPLVVGANYEYTSSSIQVATIPDKAIICIRDSNSNLNSYEPNWFATINKCSVNFNAKQNILANASQQLLHRLSVEAGSVQSWLEFSGRANVVSPTQGFGGVSTTGSVLCLNFGEHIEVPEMYLAPASAGQFNLQFVLNVTNNGTVSIVQPTLIVILMTSGVFSSEKGQSQTFVSLLNKDGVMAVLDEAPVASDKLKRLVGGSWLSSLVRVGKVLAPALAPMAKDLLKSTGNKYANAGADLIGALGYGRSAGGMSAGGRSAGALKGHLM